MSLCKYKNIFGEPKTGIHNIRILDISVFDILIVILIGIFIHQIVIVNWLHLHNSIKLWMIISILFIIGIFVHRLFCVRTTIDKLLFEN